MKPSLQMPPGGGQGRRTPLTDSTCLFMTTQEVPDPTPLLRFPEIDGGSKASRLKVTLNPSGMSWGERTQGSWTFVTDASFYGMKWIQFGPPRAQRFKSDSKHTSALLGWN